MTVLQVLYASHSRDLSKAYPFSVTLLKRCENTFRFGHMMNFPHPRTQTNEKISEKVGHLRCFEQTLPFDICDLVFNRQCLLQAAEDAFGRTASPNYRDDDTSDEGDWYGVMTFRSKRSVHDTVR